MTNRIDLETSRARLRAVQREADILRLEAATETLERAAWELDRASKHFDECVNTLDRIRHEIAGRRADDEIEAGNNPA